MPIPAVADGDADSPVLISRAAPSEAGPLEAAEAAALPSPPQVELHPALQTLRFNQRQIEFVFGAKRRHGEIYAMRSAMPGGPIVTSHPDHVRSLFTAPPDLAPTLARESPLRPIVGPNSVLTTVGPAHLRQRKLLLPHFHGEVIARYSDQIAAATERELDSWPLGVPFALAPRMQAITLDVIMAGIFGIDGAPARGSAEHRLRAVTKFLVDLSTRPIAQVGELLNIGRTEPIGPTRMLLAQLDRRMYALIDERRRAADLDQRRDILSLLIQTRAEEGEAIGDREIRDELITLVLAGHETTANSLAWAWERMLRTPAAHSFLLDAVRGGDREEGEAAIEATINETMRARPVVPAVGRRVLSPWQLGPYGIESDSAVMVSVLLLHHREDLYPRPFEFLPERWLGQKPGTYEWLPFGGGTRRCLGATLAMAEQRVVLEAMARRLDLEAAEPGPERALHRNVTMIPAQGARAILRART